MTDLDEHSTRGVSEHEEMDEEESEEESEEDYEEEYNEEYEETDEEYEDSEVEDDDADAEADADPRAGVADATPVAHPHEALHADGKTTKQPKRAKMQKVFLNVDLTFAKKQKWPTTIAFRELLQNFCDGIVRENHEARPFCLVADYKERKTSSGTEITIKYFNKDTSHVHHYITKSGIRRKERKLYGYIKFIPSEERGKDDEELGRVELTNFKARIKRQHFMFDGTDKFDKVDEAGAHGEGMKIAGKILSAQGHSLRITSDSKNLQFRERVSDSQLLVTWSNLKIDEGARRDAWRSSAQGVRKLKANKWEDVRVIVGGDEQVNKDYVRKEEKVSINDFKQWIRITPDINGPTSRIETDVGEIFLDPDFRNRLYLMSLRLDKSRVSSDDGPYRYGYNLGQAEIGRDREELKSSLQESKKVHDIWAAAINGFDKGRDKVPEGKEPDSILTNNRLEKYVDLYRNYPDCADVANAKKVVKEGVAKKIWEFLRKQSGLATPPLFYLEEGDKNGAKIVQDDLVCQPCVLNSKFWAFLRFHKFGLECRSPKEEQANRFSKRPCLSTHDLSPFARHVYRNLECLIRMYLEPRENLHMRIVDGTNLAICQLFEERERRVSINSKYLEFDEAHSGNSGCGYRSKANFSENDAFICDHQVRYLLTKIVNDVTSTQEDGGEPAELIELASNSLLWMARKLECNTTDNPCELQVTWKSNVAPLQEQVDDNSCYLVQLHERFCTALENGEGFKERDSQACCGVGPIELPLSRRSATFSNLTPGKEYHALVVKKTDPGQDHASLSKLANVPLVAITSHAVVPLSSQELQMQPSAQVSRIHAAPRASQTPPSASAGAAAPARRQCISPARAPSAAAVAPATRAYPPRPQPQSSRVSHDPLREPSLSVHNFDPHNISMSPAQSTQLGTNSFNSSPADTSTLPFSEGYYLGERRDVSAVLGDRRTLHGSTWRKVHNSVDDSEIGYFAKFRDGEDEDSVTCGEMAIVNGSERNRKRPRR